MITEFKRIGIVTRPQTPRIEVSLHKLIDFLLAEKIDVFIDRESVEGGVVHPECAAPATKQKTLTKATAAGVHWCRYSVSASSDIEPVTCDV